MPYVNILLIKGKSKQYKKAIADGVQQALIRALNIPEKDRFQTITEYEKDNFIVDPTYMNINRSENAVIIYITLKTGRTPEMKQNLYKQIIENLSNNPAIRKEDVMIILVDNEIANWSFGNGVAQLIEKN